MAAGAIARVLLGLAVKGLKKSKPKKVVKKPKSAKVAKLSSADDAKAAADWKLRKKANESGGMQIRKTKEPTTRVIDRKKFRTRKSPNATKVEYKVTRAGKRPVIKRKDVAVAAVAAGGAYTAGKARGPAGKTVKVKGGTKPVRWRNSKRVGRTKVASKLRTEYNPKTDQWIKYTD